MEFRLVDPELGSLVYQWHRGFAAANDNLFPRPWGVYEKLAGEGRIWCVQDHKGNYVGLSYFHLDGAVWEVGGLMVDTRERKTGVGSILARLTLGHLLFEEDPLRRGERVVVHVHAENEAPRVLIEKVLKFRHHGRVSVLGSELPGLKTNAEGFVEGDEFEMNCPETLVALADWCDGWTGALKDGRQVQITLAPRTSLSLWAEAFRDMAGRC